MLCQPKKDFCPLDKPYWATTIDRKFDCFPSFSPMANRRESAPDGKRHFYVLNNNDNQRLISADHPILMQHQYDLSLNPGNIQPSSYFQNTHPNSRAVYGDARAARLNPSVARVRRGDAPPPPRRPASAPLPEPTAPNAAMIQRQPSQYSNYDYSMPDQQWGWTTSVVGG